MGSRSRSRSRSRSGSPEDGRSSRPDERQMETVDEAGDNEENTKMDREDHKDSDDGGKGKDRDGESRRKRRRSSGSSRGGDRRSRSPRSRSRERKKSRSRSRSPAPRRSRRSRSRDSRSRSRSRGSPRRGYGGGGGRDRDGGRDWSFDDHNEDEGYRLHVADLDSNAAKRDLEKLFGKYGPLKEIWMARSVPCFAFCVFRYREDAEEAQRKADGLEVCGRRIRVTIARPRTRGRGQNPRFDPGMRCYQCGERGHFSRDCPDSKWGYKRPPSPRRSRDDGRRSDRRF